MIGIIAKKTEVNIINEFFQLFKTPWEFFKEQTSYDVVIQTDETDKIIDAKLIIIFGSQHYKNKNTKNLQSYNHYNNVLINTDNTRIPIYGDVLTFKNTTHTFLRLKNESVGIQIKNNHTTIVRIGYDLFNEISFLISQGQPPVNALIPTLERHIQVIRTLIIQEGITFVEIPPIPSNTSFMVCLTHDVDFVSIRDHFFDRSMLGFVYRASIGSLLKFFQKKVSWSHLLTNLKSVLSLPFVYLGICRDFWNQFDNYLEIEKKTPATYFFIPFKKKHGKNVNQKPATLRAAKYDINEVKSIVQKLLSRGCEIGLHGIDAWNDQDSALKEKNQISNTTGINGVGVRIHWLYFNENSFQILDKAGYLYDSTFGYNDTVGFRAGTQQPFQPISAEKLIEIPLIIQDTALFSKGRMNLIDKKANTLCSEIINKSHLYGGVLTILWHQRSIAPERLYGDFYMNFINELKNNGVWFGTGNQILEWFKKRRNISFGNITRLEDTLEITLKNAEVKTIPGLILRIYNSNKRQSNKETIEFLDIPINGQNIITLSK